MTTREEFEAAPPGSTATGPKGKRAIKTFDTDDLPWHSDDGGWLGSDDMAREGWALDPAPTGPATAREALDLAWELAHPVKMGETIPDGAHYLRRWTDDTPPTTHSAHGHIDVMTAKHTATVRLLDPLPEPAPDWLDAPAVLARVDGWSSCADPQVFARHDYHDAPSEWRYNGSESYHWSDLRDVTPLYPKEDA